MKCLDKKRIKMKGGETLALNERIMLSLVSTGVSMTVVDKQRFLHKWSFHMKFIKRAYGEFNKFHMK